MCVGRSAFLPPKPFVGLGNSTLVAEALRAARHSRGLSQMETAAAANMSREALSHIENGRGARTETLHNLLDVLGYEAAFLPRVADSEQVEIEPLDATSTVKRLKCYVQSLVEYDEEFRLRVILHGFGLVWQDSSPTERMVLVAEEPALFDKRWDVFLAAYVEHLCYHAKLDTPDWTQHEDRYLKRNWWPGDPFEFERSSIVLNTPAAFEAHGIWIDERELKVV